MINLNFVELNKTEFKKIEDKMPHSNYYQTVYWANIKAVNGWASYYVGIKDDKGKFIGASLLLARKIFGKYCIFYAPRGPMLDYDNLELVEFFATNIKKFIKERNGFFFKMDPMVEYKHHNSDGDLLDDGFSNEKLHEYLINLGFKHKGFRIGYVDELQFRWSYAIDIANKIYDEAFASFSSKGRGHIRKAYKYPFVLKEVDDETIKDFKAITEHTAERHNHFDRTMEYYETLIDNFKEAGRIRAFVLYLDKNKYKEDCKDDKFYEEIVKEEKDMIPISCALFIMDKDTVNYVYSGSFSKYNYFNAQYMIQNEMIKWAISEGYKVYDFGGISGNFEIGSPDYGVYTFKKNFNGRVIEYIGEYDLVANRFLYFMYKKGYTIYRNSKKLISRLKKIGK